MRFGRTFGAIVAAALVASPANPAPLAAQEPQLGSVPTASTLQRERLIAPGKREALPSVRQEASDSAPALVSPGGAFLRSLLVPGWGDAAVGSYGRAAFYFVTSAATGWMLFKTSHYLRAAREDRALAAAELEARLKRGGITNPDTLAARVAADGTVKGLAALESSRSSQMQDWTALGVFWLLLNATDAFVSAHLANFPKPVEIQVRPGAPGGRSEVRFSVPLGP